MRTVHFVVPDGIDDPARPSGGNAYDRRVCRGLAGAGWVVHVHRASSDAALAQALAQIPDSALVVADGLVTSRAPEVVVPETARLRIVALVHMPLRDERERTVLSATASVVTTSGWARRELLELYSLPDDRVQVAQPGVDAAELAPGTTTAGALLSVATVIPGKGHDVLLDALVSLPGSWHCTCVGSLDRDARFVERLRRRAADGGIADRVHFSGPQAGGALSDRYSAADLLVLPSRAETYGMVVTEALARGLPVVASDVGGVPEALGLVAGRGRPGLLVPPGDPAALRAALRAWLDDAGLRGRLRRAARERRESLTDWSTTTSAVAGILARAA